MKIDFAKRRRVIGQIQLLACAFGFMGLSSCAAAPDRETAASTRPELEVSFNKEAGRGDWLYLTLCLENGEELLFELDTGAPVTVLDKSLEPKLGKRLNKRTITYAWKKVTAGVYPAPELYLGKTRLLTGDQVWTDELSRNLCRPNPGRPVMGILGMDCLRHYCVQLDFSAGKIRFLAPDHPGDQGLGKAFQLALDHSGYVTIRENFTGSKGVTPIIDVGCLLDGVLEPKEFELELREQKAAWTNQAKDPRGFPRCTASLPNVVFGGETYTNFLIDKAPGMMGKGRPCYFNAIGLRFLARHLVTFDFPKRTMYLKRVSVGPLALPPLTSPAPGSTAK